MRSLSGPSGPNEFGYSAISRNTGGRYPVARGAVAERLGRGLQSLVQRFESARRLRRQVPQSSLIRFVAAETLESERGSVSSLAAVAMSLRATADLARPKSAAKLCSPMTR